MFIILFKAILGILNLVPWPGFVVDVTLQKLQRKKQPNIIKKKYSHIIKVTLYQIVVDIHNKDIQIIDVKLYIIFDLNNS